MKEKKVRAPSIYLGIMIIIFSSALIILFSFEVNKQKEIIAKQKQIIDENRQWVEKITFWEVTGGLGQNIIEGEKLYYDALAKYSIALQAQILAIVLIILLSIIIVFIGGFLFLKLTQILLIRID